MTKVSPIENCITQESPDYGDEDFLVIYAKGVTNPHTFVDAYLDAAEIIVERLSQNRMGPLEDQIALPLLNLYVNALEFSLKYYINATDSHRLKKHCACFKSPPNNFKKTINSSHDLMALVKIVQTMQPDTNHLHVLPDITYISDFIQKLLNLGIRSESTRYVNERGGRHYPLYDNQTWVYPSALHRSVKFIVNTLLNNFLGKEFELCDVNEFSKSRREELSTAVYLLEKNADIFKIMQFPVNDTESEFTLRSYLNRTPNPEKIEARKKFNIEIEKKDHHELSFICMGLYFTRSPITIENVDFFLNWDRDRLLRKIDERSNQYVEALEQLKKHLLYVQDKSKKRGLT